MSKNVTLVKTPLDTRVGKNIYKFVTFQDIYEACLNSSLVFAALRDANNKNDLDVLLLKYECILPEVCFEKLQKYLSAKDKKGMPYADFIQDCLNKKLSWEESKKVPGRAECHWNDCPA